jgi:hypothetical protein
MEGGWEVTGYQRKLHNEKHQNAHSSPNTVVIKSKKTSWVGHVGCMGRCAYMVLVVTAEGKRQLRRPGHR